MGGILENGINQLSDVGLTLAIARELRPAQWTEVGLNRSGTVVGKLAGFEKLGQVIIPVFPLYVGWSNWLELEMRLLGMEAYYRLRIVEFGGGISVRSPGQICRAALATIRHLNLKKRRAAHEDNTPTGERVESLAHQAIPIPPGMRVRIGDMQKFVDSNRGSGQT
jgi:hypothetical protein